MKKFSAVLAVAAIVVAMVKIDASIKRSRGAKLEALLEGDHKKYCCQQYEVLWEELGKLHARKGQYANWSREEVASETRSLIEQIDYYKKEMAD
jgi:hypothetical protein